MRNIIGEAFVEIRPLAEKFGVDLQFAANKALTDTENALTNRWTALGLGLSSAASVASFAGVDAQLREVVSLGGGNVEAQLDSFTESLIGFRREFGTLSDEAVPAFYQALSAGVPQTGLDEFLVTAQTAATAGVATLTESVSVLTSVTNAYRESGLSATEASDVLFTVVKNGVTTFPELAASLANVTPRAAEVGVSLQEVGAAVATLTLSGVGTAEATTQIRQALVELDTTSTQVAQTFQQLTGQTFREFVAAGGDLGGALKILDEEAQANGRSVASLFGSVEAAGAAALIAAGDFATFDRQLAATQDSAGATDEAFEILDGGLGRTFDRLNAFRQEIQQGFGSDLAPTVRVLADAALEAAPAVADLADVWGDGIGAATQGLVVPAMRVAVPLVEALATALSAVPSEVLQVIATYRLLRRLNPFTHLTNVIALFVAQTKTAQGAVGAIGQQFPGVAAGAARLSSAMTLVAAAAPLAIGAVALGLPVYQTFQQRQEENRAATAELARQLAEVPSSASSAAGSFAELAGELIKVRDAATEAGDATGALDGQGAVLFERLEVAGLSQQFNDLGVSAQAVAEKLGSGTDAFDDFRNRVQNRALGDGFADSFLVAAEQAGFTAEQIAQIGEGLDGLSDGQIVDLATEFDRFGDAADTEGRQALERFIETLNDLADSDVISDDFRDATIRGAEEAFASGGKAGVASFIDAVRDSDLADLAGEAGLGLDDLAAAASDTGDALAGDLADGADDAARSLEELADKFPTLADRVGSATDALDDYFSEYRRGFDTASRGLDLTEDLAASYRDLGAAVEDARTNDIVGDFDSTVALSNLTENGRNARDALQEAGGTILDIIANNRDAGASIGDLNFQLQAYRLELLNAAEGAGISREEAEKFLDETLKFPDKIDPEFEAVTDPAVQAVNELQRAIDRLPDEVRIRIVTQGGGAATVGQFLPSGSSGGGTSSSGGGGGTANSPNRRSVGAAPAAVQQTFILPSTDPKVLAEQSGREARRALVGT